MPISSETFPRLSSISAGHMFRRVAVYRGPPTTPQLIVVPFPENEEHTKCALFTSEWNMFWEAGPYRPEDFHENIPESLPWISRLAERHVDSVLLPTVSGNEYEAYGPLYHLLPERLLRKHRLPVFEGGHWPRMMPMEMRTLAESSVPALRRAFGELIWPVLTRGRSTIAAHPTNDSLVLLAQNLGFWLPPLERVLRARGVRWGRARTRDEEEPVVAPPDLPADLEIHTAAMGGPLWEGEAEAREALDELVDAADAGGRLRGAVDAIQRGRVEEDFSSRWSYEREDFERKLYSKRSKARITFVEMTDTTPMLGPGSDVAEGLLWRDVMAIVDPRDRRVIVILQAGHTSVGDIARELGYANHSPVSKALARIRKRAATLFNIS